MDVQQLQKKANEVRRGTITMIHNAQTGHVGGALSAADYLTALYYRLLRVRPEDPAWPDRDRFVLSKGHCTEPLYYILADRGFFPRKELATFSRPGTRLIGHTNRAVPGVEMNTGALGHGLPGACGMALAAKKDGAAWRTFCLLGDGELDEGSVWEAAMFAANYALDNLFVAVDRNHLQISGDTERVMRLEPLAQRFAAFGFDVAECDGNDMGALVQTLEGSFANSGRPHMLLLHTVKGKGVSYMENKAAWHHGRINAEEYAAAMQELNREK